MDNFGRYPTLEHDNQQQRYPTVEHDNSQQRYPTLEHDNSQQQFEPYIQQHNQGNVQPMMGQHVNVPYQQQQQYYPNQKNHPLHQELGPMKFQGRGSHRNRKDATACAIIYCLCVLFFVCMAFAKGNSATNNCPNWKLDAKGNKICNAGNSNAYDDFYYDSNGKKVYTGRTGSNLMRNSYITQGQTALPIQQESTMEALIQLPLKTVNSDFLNSHDIQDNHNF